MQSFLKAIVKIVPLAAMAFLVTVAYLPTFSGDFILDDRPFIEKNQYIRTFHPLSSYFSQEDGIVGYCVDSHSGYYRPLVNFSYTVDYKMWGMKASGFRTTNLALHILSCFCLYHIIATLFGGRLVPFVVTLLFGLHPINSEAVAWVSGRNNLLVTLFSLLSFQFYLKALNKSRIFLWTISVSFFLMALFSKEFAIMLLPIFFLYRRLIGDEHRILKTEMLSYLPFVLVLAIYLVLRTLTVQSILTTSGEQDFLKGLYFAPFLVIYNLKLILFPYWLHSFIIQYPQAYLSWQAFTGFVSLGLVAFILWLRRGKKMLLFSFLSFLIGLFPVLNIISTSAPTLISMRWLYFPLTFLAIAAACCLEKMLQANRLFYLCILTLVAVYFGSYSYISSVRLKEYLPFFSC